MKLTVWDTAGIMRYKPEYTCLLKIVATIVIVYDCTHEYSFVRLKKFMKELREDEDPRAIKLLVANKVGEGEEKVKRKRGYMFAKEYGMKFFEISPKDDAVVEKLLYGQGNYR
eukprot:TRINITY_DN16141_c0_g1_i2.p2 TRINITY_DN16141_c0_g1~~TRINITY_DN16141_c0_g1_i2.p2  ORF type:complete len:113 (+),score=15.10 TRINITY_DN16141_c0_g1_i2:282-620(+)